MGVEITEFRFFFLKLLGIFFSNVKSQDVTTDGTWR
jgi:hypothetical protein